MTSFKAKFKKINWTARLFAGVVCGLLAIPGVATSATKDSAGKTTATSDLEVQIQKIPNDDGSILISLHNGAETFPDKGEPFKTMRVRAKAGEISVTFRKLPVGTYALAFFQDANSNGKLDTNLVGYPSEPFGFSQDPSIGFGAPSFDKTKFEVTAPNTNISAKMN